MSTPHTLHHANDGYSDQLLASINQAEERILLETMALDHLGNMDKVLDACIHARKRGAEVLMVYDLFSHGSILTKEGPRTLSEFHNRIQQLEEEGVIIQRVGAREINPFAGRHHAKAVVVDDHAYIGGGINLSGDSFETNDFMLRFDDKELVNALYDSLPLAASDRPDDTVLFANDTTEVLLDGGAKKQSLIYERVCNLAEQAEEIFYVSKLAPDKDLLKILKEKNTHYWFNSVKSAAYFDKLAIAIDQTKAGIDNQYQDDAVLHAKFCVFKMPDGQFEAVTGSHNFNSRGVAFGTQEIALHTKDQALCQQLIDYTCSL